MGSNAKKTKTCRADIDPSCAEDNDAEIDICLPVININDDSNEDKSATSSDTALLTKERSSSTSSTSRNPSMSVLIPKLPGGQQGSCESINQSPQSSPGYDVEPPSMRLPETAPSGVSLSRKESYKDQRRKYRTEKKRVAKELLTTLKDPSVVVLADWLKVRGTLKGWTKLWCVLKPGMLLLYKSSKAKSSHWTGTVLLNTCELIERPSKKDGFCFKLFHPLEQSIWATKGPEGETIGAMVQPLPSSHLIFRAPSQAAGKCWMDALELAARCSSILLKSMTSSKTDQTVGIQNSLTSTKWNESDYEKHFKDQDLDDASHTDEYEVQRESEHFSGAEAMSGSESESDDGSVKNEDEFAGYDDYEEENEMPAESSYVYNAEGYIGESGEQMEELAEENKSLIWFLLKQVRPGMDLSKVVLPTFILEPRSFLDKLSDYYYHADLLSKAVQEDDPYTRMKEVVRWYFSGFYKKPKGLKKPYNPILGETFRCYWKHPNNSRTFYVAEQVSHHPPVSALYITNRQEGFSVSATILAKSKFYGNSTSAILDGNARLTLLPRGEDYVMNMPYAHCKGILMGTLTMELGGKVTIECEKTGYVAELEFKLKPFLSGVDASNLVTGKLKLGKETLATMEGRWDRLITLTDKRTGEEEMLWEVTKEVKDKRLSRYAISLDQQGNWESEKLWNFVSLAIKNDDQVAATEEKTILEEAQRAATRERKVKCEEWIPMYFRQDHGLGVYVYHYADLRPWDPRTDLFQYEFNYTVSTKTKHKAPMIRTASIISVDPTMCESGRVSVLENKVRIRGVKELTRSAETSSGEVDELPDAIDHPGFIFQTSFKDRKRPFSNKGLLEVLEDVKSGQEIIASEVKELRRDFESLQRRLSAVTLNQNTKSKEDRGFFDYKIGPFGGSVWMTMLMGLVIYSFLQWALGWVFYL